MRELVRWAGALARHPVVLTSEVLRWSSDELQALSGMAVTAPEAGDRRFADPAWEGRLWSRVAQSYLVSRAAVLRSVDHADLDPAEAERTKFFVGLVADALAPTNFLAGNPVALARAWETRGRSLVAGARNLAHDLQHNGGMPSQVDAGPFRVGETIAVTPGAVVHRTELYELIQYAPQTAEVCSLPLVIIPPQINRYYFLDLAPGRSFAEHCVQQGIPDVHDLVAQPRRRSTATGTSTTTPRPVTRRRRSPPSCSGSTRPTSSASARAG